MVAAAQQPQRLLIVDLSSVFFPAWHAGADKPIGFAYEATIGRVREAAKHFDHVVIACDSGRSFRKDIAPTYKANRDEKDATLIEQLRRTQDTLAADGFLVSKADNFEADDVVATFTKWAIGQGLDTEILSSDKDLLALVGPAVHCRSVKSGQLFGLAEVQAKLGVRPDQVRDWLCLVGDASDGVAGVAGVGPKHAARLLGLFGSLGGILEALDARDERDNPVVTPPGIFKALDAASKDGTIDIARQLVTLRFDVPVRCEALYEPREVKPLRPDFGADLEPEEDDVNDETDDIDELPPQPRVIDAVAEPAPSQPTAAPKPQPAPTQATAPQQQTAMALAPSDARWSLEPRSMKDAVWLAAKIHESRLFTGYGQPEQVLMTILTGREMGLGAMTALRGMHVIKGKVAMGASLMMGLVLSSGRAEYFELVESTPRAATYATKRKGSTREVKMTFTVEQARQMGLVQGGSQWDKDAENMCRHRAASRLARAVYPDVVANCYLPDEIEET